MIFKPDNLYMIEYNGSTYYSFGKNLQYIEGTNSIYLKSSFKKRSSFLWFDDKDYVLHKVSPRKGSETDYAQRLKPIILSEFEITDLGPDHKYKIWINQTREDIERILDESRENYKKLPLWKRFLLYMGIGDA